MKSLGIISVVFCLCGLLFAVAGSDLWVAAVCIGLMLSTIANARMQGEIKKPDRKPTKTEQDEMEKYRESAIHFLTTFQSIDGELPMTREEAERHLDRPNAQAQLPPERPKAAEGTRSAPALRAVNCSATLG